MDDDEDVKAQLIRWAEEPLLPELEPYVEELPWDENTTWKVLRHPLVYSIPLGPPGLVNEQYRTKTTALARYEAKEDWHTVVFLHERPYRAETLYGLASRLEIEQKLDAKMFWQLCRQVWTDTENAAHMSEVWDALFEEFFPGEHEHMMDDEERAYLNSLTEPITVYRGAVEGLNEDGLSWTLERGQAMWFALRFGEVKDGGIPVVLTAQVHRHEIVAYLTTRNEEEILLFPETVRNLEYQAERIKRTPRSG